MGKRKSGRLSPAGTFEFEIRLRHVRPAVWRRFVVPGDMTLARLHDVIQTVMGWTDSHLHMFEDEDGRSYQPPNPFDDGLLEWHDSRRVRVAELLGRKGAGLLYTYDFGDGWEHDLTVVAITDGRSGAPRCLDCAGACPPEDCGGFIGYEEALAALDDPDHPDREELLYRIPDGFDPHAFSVTSVNAALKRQR